MEISSDVSARVQQVAIQFVPFVMAVVFHEYAHGFVANKWGDSTAKDEGRLTMNPLPHMDPLGTVLFPLLGMFSGLPFLFGWAKPVPINPGRFKKYRPGLFWVSFAGPGMNFFLAILSAAILCGLLVWAPSDFYLSEPLLHMARASVTLNFALGAFNLVPIPPLDGSKVIQSFLSHDASRKYESMARYSFFIIMGLLMTGAFSFLIYPIEFMTNFTLYVMARIFHIPVQMG